MKIAKDKTQQFYETYIPCNCSDCRYFIKHFESLHPEICSTLREFGIDPKKPYELISFYHPKERKMEYADCAYLVIGDTFDYEKDINGIKITSTSQNQYPFSKLDEPYFFLHFGPIHMNCMGTSNRHLSYQDKLNLIKKAIDEIDPMKLLQLGCPSDEYIREAELIIDDIKIRKINSIHWKKIQVIFSQQFDEVLPRKICVDIANRIITYLDLKDYIIDFEEIESLKGKVSLQDYELKIQVHDSFIISYVCGHIFINDKFYAEVEDQDLFEFVCDLVEDKDVIFVQYQHKHFHFSFTHASFHYFKVIQKKKYVQHKLKHFSDIELIFDNTQTLYSTEYKDLSEEEIIEMMYQEKIKQEYEKVFYSLDRKKRLLVFKNAMGSYSYFVEKLTIVDPEERKYCSCYAVWEPVFGNPCVSFYESIDDLLKDISYQIKDWKSKE